MLLVTAAGVTAANPGAPNFSPALYGDGAIWGTKGAELYAGRNLSLAV
jgi:hypothetical protein